MKVNVLRDLSTAELEKKVVDLKVELFNLRFQIKKSVRILRKQKQSCGNVKLKNRPRLE